MRKLLIVLGVISAIFLMVSNSTAVPQINSEPIIKNISDNKQQVALIEEKLEFYIEKLSVSNPNIQPKGIFDILLAIITAIINFIISVIDSLINFIQVIWQLLSTLVTKIKNLINLIIQFIEWLQGLFNPRSTEVI